jgi:hypothetical protein
MGMSLTMPARSRFGVTNVSACDGFGAFAASKQLSGMSSKAVAKRRCVRGFIGLAR